MKALLSLCSILFFICTISFPFTVAQESTPVLDNDGNELKVGTKYDVVSAIGGAGGGGLTSSKYLDADCPITVSQEEQDTSYGLPSAFHPENSEESVIHLLKSLKVKFEASVPCANSTVWQAGNFNPMARLPLIQIGGVLGIPGCNSFRNWFKIKKGSLQRSYKFVLNPDDMCNFPTTSYNFRVNRATGQRPLVLSKDYQFEVVFIKYDRANGNKAYVQ